MDELNVMYIWNDTTMGGASQSLLDMVKGIRNKVQPVVIMKEKNVMEEYLSALGIKYYIVPFPRDQCLINTATVGRAEQNFADDYEAALKLIEIIHKENIRLIHINSSTGNVGAITALMMKIPYVWHIREFLEEDFGCEFLDKKLKGELFSRASTLVAISDCVQQSYIRKYQVTPVRIYNGIDINKFKKELKSTIISKSIFLFAGMITPEKGQFDAIKAVELMINRGYRDIRLNIVGDGRENYVASLKKYVLERRLENNIRFFPFQKDLANFREEATYSITGSKYEALGRTTIEAMLAGNIVIGADTGGTREIIGEAQERGYLYRQGDYKNLAEIMQKAMEEPIDSKMKRRMYAQEYATVTFDLQNYCAEIITLYENILNKKSNLSSDLFLFQLQKRYTEIENKRYKRLEATFGQTSQWLHIRQSGYSLSSYFENHNIKEIAIYGMAYLGWSLYNELKNSSIKISYVMDRNSGAVGDSLMLINPDDELLPKVDAIVVTVVSQQEELVRWLKTRCSYCVIGLIEILNSVYAAIED
ncbi:MAG: glycosyltransferase family 4 protein [Lachnospiraceae bacterium]|nr:glycosyltransferase family 4 protein [Lachnospiraceae bacterium]